MSQAYLVPPLVHPSADDTQRVQKSRTDVSPASLSEKLVFHLLGKMSRGGLRLTYPDGKTRDFGEENAPISAFVTIRNRKEFFDQCAFYGNVGMGEAFSQNLWDTDDIKAVITWFIDNMNALQGSDADSSTLPGVNLLKWVNKFRHLRRKNTIETSRQNIAEHYDLGNDFYRLWLDETMTYSCGIFEQPGISLAEAQFAKYDALCQKLQLKSTDHVLEIGCGWGGFSRHAAKHYGCRVTGVTISEAQAAYARKLIEQEGLEKQIEIRIQDYRLIQGQFDKIASIEMIEAVGDEYHESFFKQCATLLAPDGILGLQMITVPDCRYDSLRKGVDWIQRVIFPGSLLLSIGRANDVMKRTGNLYLYDLQDMGAFYVETLRAWHDRFVAKLPEIRAQNFDEAFIRTWRYYLKYCEAGFDSRNISVVQAIYTRPNNMSLRPRTR